MKKFKIFGFNVEISRIEKSCTESESPMSSPNLPSKLRLTLPSALPLIEVGQIYSNLEGELAILTCNSDGYVLIPFYDSNREYLGNRINNPTKIVEKIFGEFTFPIETTRLVKSFDIEFTKEENSMKFDLTGIDHVFFDVKVYSIDNEYFKVECKSEFNDKTFYVHQSATKGDLINMGMDSLFTTMNIYTILNKIKDFNNRFKIDDNVRVGDLFLDPVRNAISIVARFDIDKCALVLIKDDVSTGCLVNDPTEFTSQVFGKTLFNHKNIVKLKNIKITNIKF